MTVWFARTSSCDLREKIFIFYSFWLISVDFWKAVSFIPYTVHVHTTASGAQTWLCLGTSTGCKRARILLLIFNFLHLETLNQRLEKAVALFLQFQFFINGGFFSYCIQDKRLPGRAPTPITTRYRTRYKLCFDRRPPWLHSHCLAQNSALPSLKADLRVSQCQKWWFHLSSATFQPATGPVLLWCPSNWYQCSHGRAMNWIPQFICLKAELYFCHCQLQVNFQQLAAQRKGWVEGGIKESKEKVVRSTGQLV